MSRDVKSAQEKSVYFFDTSLHINSNVCFDKVRVIDNRINKESIGNFVIEGFKLKTKDIVTKEPLSIELERFILNIISSASSRSNELLIVIYNFIAEDMRGDLKRASLFIKADIFLGDNDQYQFVRSVDSFYEIIADNTTPILWGAIGETVFNIISGLDSIPSRHIPGEHIYTIESAQNRIADVKRTIPIYNASFAEGLYKTREEFLEGTPSFISFLLKNVKVTESLTKTLLYTKDNNDKKGKKLDPEEYYAAYDKESGWFIRYKQTLCKAVFENADFYVFVNKKGDYKSMVNGVYMPGMTGWVGILISLAPDRYKVGATYEARLDVETGKLVPVKRIK